MSKFFSNKKPNRYLMIAGGLLVLVGVVANYLDLINPPGTVGQLERIETAMQGEDLLLIGYANVRRLDRLVSALEDNAAIEPVAKLAQSTGLVKSLKSLGGRIEHVVIAVSGNADTLRPTQSLALIGNLDKERVLEALESDHEIIELAEGRYEVTRKPQAAILASNEADVCPADPEAREADDAEPPTTYFLRASGNMVLLTSEDQIGERLLTRYDDSVADNGTLTEWRQYREGQMFAAMLFIPGQAWKTLDGIAAVMVRKASSDSPDLERFGIRAGLVNGNKLELGAQVVSTSVEKNKEHVLALETKLNDMQTSTKSVSPSVARLLNRIGVQDREKTMYLTVSLDESMLGEIEDAIQDGMSGLFGIGSGKSSEQVHERIQQRPAVYSISDDMESLPDHQVEEGEQPPLAMKGPFFFDLISVRSIEDGGNQRLEMDVEGVVKLPPETLANESRNAELSLSIDQIMGADGKNWIADERCTELPMGKKRNHEPQTIDLVTNDELRVRKSIRLTSGASVKDINRLKGKLNLVTKTRIQKHKVPLDAGYTVETKGGLTLTISRVDDHNVVYQLGGNKDMFIELRALNIDGDVLQQSWAMSTSKRFNQHYHGKIHELELYASDVIKHHEFDLDVAGLFSPLDYQADKKPVYFAPDSMDIAVWKEYAELNIYDLQVSHKDWQVWGMNKTPIGRVAAPGVQAFVTHTPTGWSTNPQMHVYFPMLEQLPGILSFMSFDLYEPAMLDGSTRTYYPINYPYFIHSGKPVVKHQIGIKPFAVMSLPIHTNLKKGEKLDQLRGLLRFNIPEESMTETVTPEDLWKGKDVNGTILKLTSINRAYNSGYELRVGGKIDKLVNVHGLSPAGKKVAPLSTTYDHQNADWRLVFPLIEYQNFEMIVATKQTPVEYDLSMKAVYEN